MPSSPTPGEAPSNETAAVREVPVVAEVQRLLAAGAREHAVLVGFETVMRDVQLAFALEIPPYWTYRAVLGQGVRSDMGYLPALLARLYAVYEPVRYGPVGDQLEGELVSLLRLIYREPALQRASATLSAAPLALQVIGVPVESPSAPASSDTEGG